MVKARRGLIDRANYTVLTVAPQQCACAIDPSRQTAAPSIDRWVRSTVYYLSPPHRVHVGSPREPRKRARAGEPIRMSPNDVADEIGLGSHGSSAASRASPGADAASRTVVSADADTRLVAVTTETPIGYRCAHSYELVDSRASRQTSQAEELSQRLPSGLKGLPLGFS